MRLWRSCTYFSRPSTPRISYTVQSDLLSQSKRAAFTVIIVCLLGSSISGKGGGHIYRCRHRSQNILHKTPSGARAHSVVTHIHTILQRARETCTSITGHCRLGVSVHVQHTHKHIHNIHTHHATASPLTARSEGAHTCHIHACTNPNRSNISRARVRGQHVCLHKSVIREW